MVHLEEMDQIIDLKINRVIASFDKSTLIGDIKYNRLEDLQIDQEM